MATKKTPVPRRTQMMIRMMSIGAATYLLMEPDGRRPAG
jgi:hypothetical protein